MLDDLSDNGYDPFDFIYIHAKTLWCNLIKKNQKKTFMIFFFKKIWYKSSINSAKPHTYTCLEGMALDCLFYDKKKNSHKPNYDCQACKASGQ